MRFQCHFTSCVYHFVPLNSDFFSSDFLTATLSEFSGTKWYKSDKNACKLASSEGLQRAPLFGGNGFILLSRWGRGGGAGRSPGGEWETCKLATLLHRDGRPRRQLPNTNEALVMAIVGSAR